MFYCTVDVSKTNKLIELINNEDFYLNIDTINKPAYRKMYIDMNL